MLKLGLKKEVSEGAILINAYIALEMSLLARTKCISTFQATSNIGEGFCNLRQGYEIWKTTLQQIWSRQTSLPPPHTLPRTHPFASPHWMDGPTDRWTDIPSYAKARTHLKKVTIQSMNLSIFARNSRHGTARLGTARHERNR